MLSPCISSVNTLNLKFLNISPSSSNLNRSYYRLKSISAVLNNPSSHSKKQQVQQPQKQLYQPFRPPPTPLPSKYDNLDIPARIDILANRLGAWHEYAPLITSLLREGFSPPTIEETTGITGVEQNRIIVATQVRDTLVANTDEEILSYFDSGGAEVLYALQHLHPMTTPKKCCENRKNRFGWLPERFSWRGKPRRCLILSERFFPQTATT